LVIDAVRAMLPDAPSVAPPATPVPPVVQAPVAPMVGLKPMLPGVAAVVIFAPTIRRYACGASVPFGGIGEVLQVALPVLPLEAVHVDEVLEVLQDPRVGDGQQMADLFDPARPEPDLALEAGGLLGPPLQWQRHICSLFLFSSRTRAGAW
jgi:hypothetical protein